MVEEAKEREVQMQNKLRAMEQQIQVLTERDQEVSSVLVHTTVFLLLTILIVLSKIGDRLSVIKKLV